MNKLQKYILFPLSVLYGTGVYIRNKLFDWQVLKSRHFNIPVISVGNITVGGTGKTPHVEYLADLLRKEFKVAVLSRGYKRKTKGFLLAGNDSTADDIGDEPMQIHSKFPDVTVAVDASRVRGISRLLEKDDNIDVILLDDAFQHRYVKPGLSILLVDYNRPLKNDHLLPAGLLREPSSSMKRANIILYSKSPDKLKAIDRRIIASELHLNPFQHLYFTGIKPAAPIPVFGDAEKNPFPGKDAAKREILLLSGIANPRSLKKFTRQYSTRITELIYPDHFAYKEEDIRHIISKFRSLKDPGFIFTTEKDAMRLKKYEKDLEEIKDRMFYIPVGIYFLNDDTSNFNKQVIEYVRNNKRNSILHKRKDKVSA